MFETEIRPTITPDDYTTLLALSDVSIFVTRENCMYYMRDSCFKTASLFALPSDESYRLDV